MRRRGLHRAHPRTFHAHEPVGGFRDGAYFQRIALFNDLNGRIDFAVQGHGLIKDGAPLYRWLELLTNPATPRRTLRLGTGRTQGSDPGFGQNPSNV